MSLRKSKRLEAKRKLLDDLKIKQLNGIYGETGPIYSIGGQFTLNLTNQRDVLKQEEDPSEADRYFSTQPS